MMAGVHNISVAHTRLGELGISKGGAIGTGAAVVPMIVGGPIGIGIGVVLGLISGIFKAHAAKVAREDEVSNAWAAIQPTAIEAVLTHYKAGSINAAEAKVGLQEIESQFVAMCRVIAKTRGKWNVFPDPNQPRPSKDCNWACGTYWDLHQQLKKLAADIDSGVIAGGSPKAPKIKGGSSSSGSILDGGNNQILILAAVGLGLFFLLK